MSIDEGLLKRDIDALSTGLRAMRRTVEEGWEGHVVTSKRKMSEWEKRKKRGRKLSTGRVVAWHGKAIANFLADKGHDPFEYPEAEKRQITREWRHDLRRALKRAYDSGRARGDMFKRANLDAAKKASALAKRNLIAGGLGHNTGSYGNLKKRMVEAGLFDRRYGSPPRRGIATGRFLRGIRAVPKQPRSRS